MAANIAATTTVQRTEKVLSNKNSWDDWFIHTRPFITNQGLWQYSDPYLEVVPSEPVPPRPLPDDFEDQLSSANESTVASATQRMTLYTLRSREYERFETRRREVLNRLERTVQSTGVDLMIEETTLHKKMKVLKDKYAPTDYEREQLLLSKLDKLKQGPTTRSLENWTTDWLDLDHRMERHSIAERTHIKRDFIHAVVKKYEALGIGMLRDLYRPNSTITLKELINEFSITTSNSPKDMSYGRSHATLGITKDTEPSANSSQGPQTARLRSSSSRPRKPCSDITGKPESRACKSRASCNVINPALRPSKQDRSNEWQRYFNNYIQWCMNHDEGAQTYIERHNDSELKEILNRQQPRSTDKAERLKSWNDLGPRLCPPSTGRHCIGVPMRFAQSSESLSIVTRPDTISSTSSRSPRLSKSTIPSPDGSIIAVSASSARLSGRCENASHRRSVSASARYMSPIPVRIRS